MNYAQRSIRVVALFEAAKGGLILLAGFGLLGLLHRDVAQTAEEIVRHFHLNPASRIPRIFLEAAAKVTDTGLWLLAAAALVYAALRLAEAIGLWRQRAWAEWLGLVSGALYIPIELYELHEGVSAVKVALLTANLACVALLLAVLRAVLRARNARKHAGKGSSVSP